jgi:hypothetical protein
MARRANDLATLAGIRKPIVYPAADPQPSQSWRFDG